MEASWTVHKAYVKRNMPCLLWRISRRRTMAAHPIGYCIEKLIQIKKRPPRFPLWTIFEIPDMNATENIKFFNDG